MQVFVYWLVKMIGGDDGHLRSNEYCSLWAMRMIIFGAKRYTIEDVARWCFRKIKRRDQVGISAGGDWLINRCSGYKTDVWNVIKTTFLYSLFVFLCLTTTARTDWSKRQKHSWLAIDPSSSQVDCLLQTKSASFSTERRCFSCAWCWNLERRRFFWSLITRDGYHCG